MPVLLRIMVSLLCVAVVFFCAFGFLATFEPTDQSPVLWRLIYGCIGAGAAACVIVVNVRK